MGIHEYATFTFFKEENKIGINPKKHVFTKSINVKILRTPRPLLYATTHELKSLQPRESML